jgi:predicted transcriptional regulator
LQRVEDLTRALETSEKTVYRHLTRLVEAALVEYITPSLSVKNTCRLYYLSQKGIQIAAEQEHIDAGSLASYQGASEYVVLHLLPRMASLLRLQELVNGLVTLAPAMLAHPGGYRAELAWHWQRDYGYTFLDQGQQWNYTADAALYFHRKALPPARGEDYCALLYIDSDLSSNDNARQIRRRLEATLHYRDRPERGYSTQMFPPLIVLACSPRQQAIWQYHAARIATTLHAQPLIGAIAVVPSGEPLESVWTLPWQKLSVAAPCRLRDLFLPLAREALPPGLLQTRNVFLNLDKGAELLHGDFRRRASTMSLIPQSGEQEQEVVALLGLCLSQRHLEVLHMLYQHPLLTFEELAALLNLQGETVTRYLYELRRYSCIEKSDEAQNTRWQLSSRGLRFIAASCHVPLQDITELEPEQKGDEQPTRQRGIVRLMQHLPLTIAIYAFFAALHDDMYESGPEHTIAWWEMGAHCEHRYTYRGNRYTLRPAAAFVYRAGQSRLSAWLEWDGLDVSEPDLAYRLDTYAQFVRSREWTAAGFSSLPMLLIITNKPQRTEMVTAQTHQHLANTGMLVRLTTTANVAEQGPLAPIWRQLLPALTVTHKKREPAQRALLDLRHNMITQA